MVTKNIIVVAKNKKTGLYACLGRQTGMGQEIDHTHLSAAKKFKGPTDIMLTLGGHYSSYDAVQVEVQYTEVRTLEFPDPATVWDR